jgi:hypothetical protein
MLWILAVGHHSDAAAARVLKFRQWVRLWRFSALCLLVERPPLNNPETLGELPIEIHAVLRLGSSSSI